MRYTLLSLAIFFPLFSGTVQAETVSLDLHDYDDELMRTLDQTIKYFEPDVTAGNAEGSAEDAGTIRDAYKWMEGYFAKKGNAEQAVQIAQQGEGYLDTAMKALAAKNLDAAGDAAHDLGRTCRSCHDIYRPAKVR